MWTKVAEIKALYNPSFLGQRTKWCSGPFLQSLSRPSEPPSSSRLSVILHTVPKTSHLFIFIPTAWKTLILFSLPHSYSPSSLSSGIMSSRRLLQFTTLRTPGQVTWGQAGQLSSQRRMPLAALATLYRRHVVIHLSSPSDYTFFKDLEPIFIPLYIPST